jgi:acyl-homoserine-lactone acylase
VALSALVTAVPAQAASDVVIRRTAYGIPHIKAKDFKGIGYGYGYALAQDQICLMADTYLTVSAQRSRYFPPDETYTSEGNGGVFTNLDSDFFYQRLIDRKTVRSLLAKKPPLGPEPAIRRGAKGYVAGYNRYLKDTGVDRLPDSRCRGKPWVKPITLQDFYMRLYSLVLLASQGVVIDGIAQAAPPIGPGPAALPSMELLREFPDRWRLGRLGSNAYGLGSQATRTGKGIVLGNPHFPWEGPERFYQAHLTIPGKVNVAGASLHGVPLILIGHTRNMGWSHTVSTAWRFTPFELQLMPGSPTSYMYDGEVRQMKAENVTVQVRGDGGELEPQTRTLYSSHHGSVFNSIAGLPVFPWSPVNAYAMGDVNAENFRVFNHFFHVNRAQSVRRLHRIETKYQGIPWVNTIAADSRGQAYYADIGSIPHVTNEKRDRCVNGVIGAALMELANLPVLDGSTSDCEWGTDPAAAVPGILPPKREPHLFRRDYVTNSNDSYWLSNPKKPLEGFDQIIGTERTPRSLRTRIGLIMADERIRGADKHPGKRFSRADVQRAVFENRQYAGELWRDELVEMCKENSTLPSSSGAPVDVSAACPVLEQWDVHDNLDSKGALLFRRFALKAMAASSSPFDTAFDAEDPVNTPRGLDTDNPEVRTALADAVEELNDSGIELNSALGSWQYDIRGDTKIPIHGGPGDPIGQFNAIFAAFERGEKEADVDFGSSFVMVASLTGSRCPDVRTILTYSQSSNPSSPHYMDQTKLFSKKRWVKERFCERAVRRATKSTIRLRVR